MPINKSSLSESARRVQRALDRFDLDFSVEELPESTRTAQDAAAAIGCEVGQIAKSLVFRFTQSSEPLLVITSGTNRVDVGSLGDQLGQPIEIADAGYVREVSGFAIGGVPPLGHESAIRTIIDQDLMKYGEIWAAAGTPRAVFKLSWDDLCKITNGEVRWVGSPT
jgi:prolyl-tRNA editing enzyme YbaK/EbsC (Cys-tRNA(Pro) deacylase)